MPLILAGATSGSTTIQATDAVTQTITLPNNTGTVLTTASTFGGTGPAFSVYQTASQTGISAGTLTKVTFDTEEFDTNNNFASSRFTPTVAGYYQLSGGVQTGGAATIMIVELWKNGSVYKRFNNSNTSSVSQLAGSSLIYLNGSTDYAELYLYIGTGTSTDATNQSRTYFNGAMVRSA